MKVTEANWITTQLQSAKWQQQSKHLDSKSIYYFRNVYEIRF